MFMSKRIKGISKGCEVPSTAKMGYKETWDMGKAANSKKRSKLILPDRPSE
jgi:hypothetical protein